MIIYDAKDMIFGRLATRVAKSALMGESVFVVNTRWVCFSGNKKAVLEEFKRKTTRGTPKKGPFFPKVPSRLFKRLMRGMLPYKKARGREALARIKCYSDVPKSLVGKDFVSVPSADITKLPKMSFVRLGEISKILGGKQ